MVTCIRAGIVDFGGLSSLDFFDSGIILVLMLQ
jgi:hypothetical protein